MTKRRPPYDGQKFTPEVLDLYRRARAIYDTDDAERWVEQKLSWQLHIMLGRQLWDIEIFETVDEVEPPTGDWWDADRTNSWRSARALLTALEQAAT
jgi:hypothetical protein